MTLNKIQKQTLSAQLQKEINCIDSCFINEINQWKRSIRILILAEAPLSCDQYFYNKRQGNFLGSLKNCFEIEQDDLLSRLRLEGILVLDMYELPIPTRHYDNDAKSHTLFDIEYFCKKLDLLYSRGLLNNSTFIIFRYKKLIQRFLDMRVKGLFNTCSLAKKYLVDSGLTPVSLNEKEWGKQELSNEIMAVLNCKSNK